MSAYIVCPTHIDVMLSVAIHGPTRAATGRWHGPYVNELLKDQGHAGPLTRETADLAGRALLGECIASVSYRCDERPGSCLALIPTPIPTSTNGRISEGCSRP